ncbi:MAG: hypothetical protein K6F33_01875 [Bacteroidales bacterium]|nr:hypothetical protein [Bacteroidales bacterium]
MLLAVASTGCDNGVFGERIKEGVITYQLEYPEGENKNSLVNMLPDDMTLAFKNDKTSMMMRGFAGIFILNCICDYANQSNNTLLTIGFKKYLLKANLGETPFESSIMSDIEITNTQDTMSICGYLCHKAIGHSDKCRRNFEFWYTQDIDIDSDCILSPVKSLGGVLMQFDVEMMGIYMKAKAIDVSRQDIHDEAFETPEGFQEISRKELDSVIHTFDGSNRSSL